MKRDVTIDYFDPTRTQVGRRDSLNILLIATNRTDAPRETEITFFGDDGRRLLRLYRETRLLPPHEHSHLYFRLPEGCFQMAGDAEELRLFAAAGDVTGREKSKLIFLTD